jgi:Ni/Co efflux regulator RcnB
MMIRTIPLGVLLMFAAAPALAQETTFTAPRFEALEQQQQALEQRQLDSLEKSRRDAQDRTLFPNPPVTAADSAVRALEIQRDIDSFRLQSEQDRAQVRRERTLSEASLPNRRIARSSILVVGDPERYALPHAPKGQYYARLDGRFVLVDAASEMVVKVLPVTPSDPTSDVPAGPRPPLQPPLPISPSGQ